MTLAGYTQLIGQPTHVINNSSSGSDLVFVSKLNVICNSGVELSLFEKCHHNLIFGDLNFIIPLPPTYKSQMWHYKKAEYIRHSISSVDRNFHFQGTSVKEKVTIFK